MARPENVGSDGAGNNQGADWLVKESLLQSANSRGVHVVGPRHVRLCFASRKACKSFLTLVLCKLAGAPESDSAFLCTLPPLARSGADQFPLKFGQATQHGEHQPAVRAGGVCP